MRVTDLVDPMQVNRMFVISERLNSEAVVEFVRALCSVSLEEVRFRRAGFNSKAIGLGFNKHICTCAFKNKKPLELQ